MNQPTFPLIAISSDQKWLNLYATEAEFAPISLLEIIQFDSSQVIYFDPKSQWALAGIKHQEHITWIKKLMAYFFHNPLVQVSYEWEKKGAYPIEHLRSLIIACVKSDDDIWSQYMDKETIIQETQACTSFQEVERVLQKFVFEVDEDALNREYDDGSGS